MTLRRQLRGSDQSRQIPMGNLVKACAKPEYRKDGDAALHERQ
jgi:hypothetical protein